MRPFPLCLRVERAFSLEVVVLLVLPHEKCPGHDGGGDLCYEHRPPDAVKAEDPRQNQHGQQLEHQRPDEGHDGGDGAVVQGGEEGGGEHIASR